MFLASAKIFLLLITGGAGILASIFDLTIHGGEGRKLCAWGITFITLIMVSTSLSIFIGVYEAWEEKNRHARSLNATERILNRSKETLETLNSTSDIVTNNLNQSELLSSQLRSVSGDLQRSAYPLETMALSISFNVGDASECFPVLIELYSFSTTPHVVGRHTIRPSEYQRLGEVASDEYKLLEMVLRTRFGTPNFAKGEYDVVSLDSETLLPTWISYDQDKDVLEVFYYCRSFTRSGDPAIRSTLDLTNLGPETWVAFTIHNESDSVIPNMKFYMMSCEWSTPEKIIFVDWANRTDYMYNARPYFLAFKWRDLYSRQRNSPHANPIFRLGT